MNIVAQVPHGTCFLWDIPLTALHAVADFTIFLAYLSIPCIMLLNRHHASANAKPLLQLYAAFIISCGIGHLLDLWNIWHANYWLEGGEKLLTAGVSAYTAIELHRSLPSLLGIQRALEVSQEVSRTDPLTGLANRRALTENIAALIGEKGGNRSHGLILLDLDGFKLVNDTYGHPVGDRLLSRIGASMRENLRSDKTSICRLGGDEFAVLLEDCNFAQSFEVAQRLQSVISSTTLKPGDMDDAIAVGVSIGIKIFSDKITNDQLFEAADRALYAAKQRGRNTISWDETDPEALQSKASGSQDAI